LSAVLAVLAVMPLLNLGYENVGCAGVGSLLEISGRSGH
jgi:hypothetical protein